MAEFCGECGRHSWENPSSDVQEGCPPREICRHCSRPMKPHFDTGWNDAVAGWLDAESRPGELNDYKLAMAGAFAKVEKEGWGDDAYIKGAKAAHEFALKHGVSPQRRE